MTYENLTNDELVRMIDNTPDASPLDRELANRLNDAAGKIEELEKKGDYDPRSAAHLRHNLRGSGSAAVCAFYEDRGVDFGVRISVQEGGKK